MVGKMGTPYFCARSRLKSFFGTCAVYSETILERGLGGWPSCRKPSRYFPTITSAWELGRYSVTMAAILFGSPCAKPRTAAAVESRNERRLCMADQTPPASKHQRGQLLHTIGVGVGIDRGFDLLHIPAIGVLR